MKILNICNNNIIYKDDCSTIKETIQNAVEFGADLSGADLSKADLSKADLSKANLYRASLSKRRNKEYDILRYQKKLILYKYLSKNLVSPYQHFKYEINKIYKSIDVNNDKREACGSGINVATLDWCLSNVNFNIKTNIIVRCECKGNDLIIPYTSDGKFRIKEGGKIKILSKVSQKTLVKYMEGM